MRPGERVWRKGTRQARKGIPTGRRATHGSKGAYAQQRRDRVAAFTAFCERRREVASHG